MPIRFTCPHCGQKLSVAQRKAGNAAECPRCNRTLIVPQPPPETKAIERTASADVLASPAGESATFLPDADDSEGLELVYDVSSEPVAPPIRPAIADVVVVPRYIIFCQGALIALVALVALVIGMILGSTFVARPNVVPQASLVTGSVTYMSGPRSRVDVGAVVVLLPQSLRPDEKAPVAGLRPTDPPPDESSKGLAILREIGAAYARTDANGRFELQAPRQGRYWLLVVSNEQKRSRSAMELNNADIAKLAPFFDNVARLLGDRRYQITAELIRGDKQLSVVFD